MTNPAKPKLLVTAEEMLDAVFAAVGEVSTEQHAEGAIGDAFDAFHSLRSRLAPAAEVQEAVELAKAMQQWDEIDDQPRHADCTPSNCRIAAMKAAIPYVESAARASRETEGAAERRGPLDAFDDNEPPPDAEREQLRAETEAWLNGTHVGVPALFSATDLFRRRLATSPSADGEDAALTHEHRFARTVRIIPWELDDGELGISVEWANGQKAAWVVPTPPSIAERLRLAARQPQARNGEES